MGKDGDRNLKKPLSSTGVAVADAANATTRREKIFVERRGDIFPLDMLNCTGDPLWRPFIGKCFLVSALVNISQVHEGCLMIYMCKQSWTREQIKMQLEGSILWWRQFRSIKKCFNKKRPFWKLCLLVFLSLCPNSKVALTRWLRVGIGQLKKGDIKRVGRSNSREKVETKDPGPEWILGAFHNFQKSLRSNPHPLTSFFSSRKYQTCALDKYLMSINQVLCSTEVE